MKATNLEWTPQNAFESGVLIGLRAAVCILERGQGQNGVAAYIDQMEDVKRRREMEVGGCREAADGDILLAIPVAHPADFGLPSTLTSEFAASFGRHGFTASVDRSPEGEDPEGLHAKHESAVTAEPADAQKEPNP